MGLHLYNKLWFLQYKGDLRGFHAARVFVLPRDVQLESSFGVYSIVILCPFNGHSYYLLCTIKKVILNVSSSCTQLQEVQCNL